MQVFHFVRRCARSLGAFASDHYLGVAALLAVVAATWLWFSVAQDTPVVINIFHGWRQAAIVACAGIAFGGMAAECVGAASRTPPGAAPACSTIVAAIFALPLYAGCILLSLL